MPFRRPVSQTGFEEDTSPKRLKTSHNGNPNPNNWPPLMSNMNEPHRLAPFTVLFFDLKTTRNLAD